MIVVEHIAHSSLRLKSKIVSPRNIFTSLGRYQQRDEDDSQEEEDDHCFDSQDDDGHCPFDESPYCLGWRGKTFDDVEHDSSFLSAPSRIRTDNLCVLSAAPLPIGLSRLSPTGGIRTRNIRILSPAPLPIGATVG